MNCKHHPTPVSELIPGAVDAVKRPPSCFSPQVSHTTDTVTLVQNLAIEQAFMDQESLPFFNPLRLTAVHC